MEFFNNNSNISIYSSRALIKLPNNLFFIMDTKDNFFLNSVEIGNGFGHEPFIIERMINFTNIGEVFVEVGANYGDFSLQMSKYIGNQGKVYAFEPGSNTFKCLYASIFLNGLSNIILENKAVLDEEKEVNFMETMQEDVNGSLGSSVSTINSNNNTTLVKAITLDNYFHSQKIDVLRLDAEGSECRILKGAQKIIDSSPDLRIFVEWQRNL
ncbi:MAG: FkbM family methyltransferase, partial [Pseudomonadota bacterium]